MTFSKYLRVGIAILSASAGITAAILPNDWIEQRFGFRPDGGNGFVELLWAAAPLAVAAVLALSLLRTSRRSTGRL